MVQSIIELAAETNFSGVVRVDVPGETTFAHAFGFADRRHKIPNRVDTRFGIASGTKGFTALAVMSAIEAGLLSLDTTARSVLGTDLPLIDKAVSIEHLLTHRSGIGDYLDESQLGDINEYVMTVPVHELASTEEYVPVLDGHPQAASPGARFAYNNSGFVVLALILQRVTGRPFEDVVLERVCEPAGMENTSFVRADELTSDIAVGYLEASGLRTNVLHLPVLGSGDGGIFTTANDMHVFWSALFDGRIVSADSVRLMIEPVSDAREQKMRYGRGLWLDESGSPVMLVGSDAGVSFRTVHDPSTGTTHTVLANTSSGAWPIARELDRSLGL